MAMAKTDVELDLELEAITRMASYASLGMYEATTSSAIATYIVPTQPLLNL